LSLTLYGQKARAFAPAKPFMPSLRFAGKGGACPSGGALMVDPSSYSQISN